MAVVLPAVHPVVDRSLNPLRNAQPRNVVSFDSTQGCFMTDCPGNGGTRMAIRGLKPLLADCFWPDYDWEAGEALAKRLALGPVARQPTATGGNARAGILRGNFVHKQIEDVVKLSTRAFQEVHRTVHPFTVDILTAIHRDMKLTLVAAEVPVMCGVGWFATAADLLAVDEKGRLIVLEVKTGMSNYFRHANRRMHGRTLSRSYDNSPMNQAYVQLLITALMLGKQYNIPVHAAYVIHATEVGVERCALPADLLKKRERLYGEVCARAIKDRQRREQHRASVKEYRRSQRRRR